MGPDKKRLSKRHGATSVMEYERQGYIPEGMANFLALLGWAPGGNDELFTIGELIERFTLEGISGGNAVFNTEKLDWFNHQHLLRLPDEELLTRLVPLLDAAELWRPSLTTSEFEWMRRVLALLKPRAKKLTEYVDGLAAVSRGSRQLRRRCRRQASVGAGVSEHLAALARGVRGRRPSTRRRSSSGCARSPRRAASRPAR